MRQAARMAPRGIRANEAINVLCPAMIAAWRKFRDSDRPGFRCASSGLLGCETSAKSAGCSLRLAQKLDVNVDASKCVEYD
jgi:hypothetical protein